MHTIIMVNNMTNELVHIVLFMFQLFDHLTSTLYLFTGLSTIDVHACESPYSPRVLRFTETLEISPLSSDMSRRAFLHRIV
jgi:hypothetical protein